MADTSKPGVYVDKDAVAHPAGAIATAMPVFIGYAEKAAAVFKPVEIASFGAFETAFGGRSPAMQALPDGTAPEGKAMALAHLLYDSMKLFFDNGGTVCWVIAAGTYADAVTLGAMEKALEAAQFAGPTMLVAPDATRLTANDFVAFVEAMLLQAGTQEDRIAILDVPVGEAANAAQTKFGQHHIDGITAFREAVSTRNLSYGAAYFPFLWKQLADGTNVQLPPSGAIAGIMANIDAELGFWMAPAGSKAGVLGGVLPSVPLTDSQQQILVSDVGGKSIDAIRFFPDLGTMVWGARTLDGNSADYRYIQIRRTLIYIEQSIENGIRQFVFEPNAVPAWQAATKVASDFLHQLWIVGALPGASSREAYSVACGAGITMTQEDIANGVMRMTVLVSLAHPAEYIALKFEQQMQTPG